MVSFGILAGTVAWKSSGRVNDWDWTASGNFEGGVLPQPGDTVVISNATTVYLKSSDSASTNVFAGLARIKTMTASSKIVFNAENAADVITVTCPVTYDFSGDVASSHKGEIVKEGPGHVFLASAQNKADYNLAVTINAGSLRLPYTPNKFGRFYFGQIYIAERATLFTCTADTQGYGYTQPYGLSGYGLVTNDSKVCNWIRARWGDGESTFHGRIDGNIKLSGTARIMLTGVDSTFSQSVSESGVTSLTANSQTANVLGIMKFGNPDEPSSIGPYPSIGSSSPSDAIGGGAGYLYLGSGERTTKSWYVQHGLLLLGGGAFGGLELAGSISWGACSPVFLLDGTNASPCTISGSFSLNTGASRYPYFYKRGTGAWRFLSGGSDPGRRKYSLGFAVEEGSLQFASLRPANEVCAVGQSLVKRCGKIVTGATVPDSDLVDYTFLLGMTNDQGVASTQGTLEPVAGTLGGVTNSFWTTDRPIALLGHGRLLMNALDNGKGVERRLTMRGVTSAAPGAHELTLDGTGVNTNTIADIVDGDVGTVSVVKKGSGLWVLAGTNTFSGALRVEEGTLAVNSARDYSWYRLMVSRLNGGGQLQVKKLSLFDADGTDQAVGMANMTGNDHTVLAPGTIADGRASIKTWGAGNLVNIFTTGTSFTWMIRYKMYSDSSTTWRPGDTCNGAPDPTKPDSWYWLDIRLPANAKAVTSYDMVQALDNIDPEVLQDSGSGDNTFKNTIRGWQLHGSVDGVHWDKLHEVVDAADTTGDMHYAPAGCTNYWMASQTKLVANETGHLNGIKIARGPATAFSQLGSATVSVAKGATLVAEGERLTIGKFSVSTNGVGTLRNFAFADSGTITFTDVNPKAAEIRIPGTYDNVTGFGSLADWTVNGAGNLQLSVKGNELVLTKRGVVIIVR